MGAGCGNDGAAGPKPLRFVDTRTATYRGVGLEDSIRTVRRRLGRPLKVRDFNDEAAAAEEPVVDFPRALPAADQVSPYDPEPELFYRRVTFLAHGTRVRGFFAHRGRVVTERGVGIGDPLAEVHDAFPELDCKAADYGEYGKVDKCDGRLGRKRYVWFGGDPVNVIFMLNSRIG